MEIRGSFQMLGKYIVTILIVVFGISLMAWLMKFLLEETGVSLLFMKLYLKSGIIQILKCLMVNKNV
jgi:hypothetical protein